jgi:hypothetical protein
MNQQPIPKGVFWVYPTNRFHDFKTRADMGDDFAAAWLPRRQEFPMSGDANSPLDGIHHPMQLSEEELERFRAQAAPSGSLRGIIRGLT